MTPEKTIFEVRQHSLMGAILIAISLSIASVLYLTFASFEPCEMVVSPSAIGGWIERWQMEHPIISFFIILSGVMCIAIKVAQLTSRFSLYGVTSRLPMELYPILSVGVGVNCASLKSMIVSLLITLSMMRFVSSYRNSNSAGVLLGGSMSLGLATLIYPPTFLLWGVVPFVLIIFERTMREVIVAAVSLLIVPVGYIYIQWLMGASFADELSRFFRLIISSSGYSIIDSFNLATVAIFGLLLYLAINATLVISLLENTIKARRRLKVISIYALILGLMLFVPSSDSSAYALMVIPLSVLAPVSLLKFGRLVSFTIYLLIFVFSIVNICMR